MKKLFILLCLLSVVSSVYAFDSERKGFILGFGLGYAGANLNSDYDRDEFSNAKESGVMTDAKIGYGISNDLAIYLTCKTGWFGDAFPRVRGIAISKHLGENPHKGVFLNGGVGISALLRDEDEDGDEVERNTGEAIFLGLGYEFSTHYSIESNLIFRNINGDDNDNRYNDLMLGLTVSALAY